MSATSDRVGSQVNELSDELKNLGAAGGDLAQVKLTEMRGGGAEKYESARDNVHGVLCNFEQCVRERPVGSILTAAGIGLLFGRFWMRR